MSNLFKRNGTKRNSENRDYYFGFSFSIVAVRIVGFGLSCPGWNLKTRGIVASAKVHAGLYSNFLISLSVLSR